MTLTKLENTIKWINNQLLANLSNEIYHELDGEEKELLAKYKPQLRDKLDKILYSLINEKMIYNQQKYITIFNELREWMNVRHLNYREQLANITGNVLEELTEIARAKDDIRERLDGLVDIAVFCINASEKPIDMYRYNGLQGMTLKTISEFIDFTNLVMNNIDDPQEIVPICFSMIENLGYDPYECMLEVCKELHSRTGEYNEAMGKFVKQQGFYTLEDAQLTYPNYKVFEEPTRFRIDMGEEVDYRPKWYKADYSKCKLKVEE